MNLLRTCALVAAAWFAASACVAATSTVEGEGHDGLVERGRRIYELGLGAGDEAVQGSMGTELDLRGAEAACARCHRRSGMGGREGETVIPPVAGAMLFAPAKPDWPRRAGRPARHVQPLRHESRRAYDGERVLRALREGVDAEGRPLQILMPRYRMKAADEVALLAYLRQLGRDDAAGPRDGILRLATIITPDADSHRAETIERAMRAWARSGALGGLPIDLQVWRLRGEVSSWGEQLRAFHRQHRPYAALSGAGGGRWGVVRDFCERESLPCLFPVVDHAPDDGRDLHSLYFSRGVVLEARLLASALRAQPIRGRVVQWIDPADGGSGRAAADRLQHDLSEMPCTVVEISGERLAALDPGLEPGDVLVAWLRPDVLRTLVAIHPGAFDGIPVHLSARLAPPQQVDLPPAWRRDTVWISAGSDPARLRGKGVLGLRPWTEQLGIELDDEALLSEVYAATYYFGDALSRMKGRWSRDWLIETLENSHFTRPAGAAFVSLSLGPGQREAAKAGQLQRYLPEGNVVSAVGPRLLP